MRGAPRRAQAGAHGLGAAMRSPDAWACAALLLGLLAGARGQAAKQPLAAIPGSVLQSNFTTTAVTVAQALQTCQTGAPAFPVVEATIPGTRAAFLAGRLTCSQLVQAYVQRIREYDQRLGVNAVRVLSPDVTREAAAADAQLSAALGGGAELPPLFCVPLLVKDNYDTAGMAASNGAAGLLDNVPAADARQVAQLRAAGALVLGKANMAEWAFSPEASIGSAFGVVRNPYATDRSAAGSSGGTAAGVAASFAMGGLGTDTGNSVRGPAGWNSLVGLRPSYGLTSRSGIIPLDSTSDMGGPLARTVEDAVRLFEATVGSDAADNATRLQAGAGPLPGNYTQFLDAGGLRGARVGVALQTVSNATASPAVAQAFQRALADMRGAGATLVENFTIAGNALGDRPWAGGGTWPTGFGADARQEQLDCGARFKVDINAYLAASGSRYKTVQALVADGQLHPSSNASMALRLGIPYAPWEYPPPPLRAAGYVCTCGDALTDPCRAEFRKRLVASMDAAGVSVLALPTWSNLPLLVGDYGSPSGNNAPQIAPPTGAPAIALPMGFAQAAQGGPPLPVSLQLIARPFDEASLIRAAFAYEQATQHRRPPAAFPECGGAAAPGGAPQASLAGRVPGRESG